MALPIEVLAEIRQNIKEAETALKEMETEVNKAQLAGIDVTAERKDAEELKAKIRQLKSVYGKG